MGDDENLITDEKPLVDEVSIDEELQVRNVKQCVRQWTGVKLVTGMLV